MHFDAVLFLSKEPEKSMRYIKLKPKLAGPFAAQRSSISPELELPTYLALCCCQLRLEGRVAGLLCSHLVCQAGPLSQGSAPAVCHMAASG